MISNDSNITMHFESSTFSIPESAVYVSLSFLVFTCINVLSTNLLPKLFSHLAEQSNFWRFKNTCVSWSHSIISTLLVITK
jgi:hypothetical protein